MDAGVAYPRAMEKIATEHGFTSGGRLSAQTVPGRDMSFGRRGISAERTGIAGGLVVASCHAAMLAGRLVLSALGIAIIAASLLYARLSSAPIEMPGLTRLLVEQVNAADTGYRFEIDKVVLDVGRGGAPAGLELRGIRVHSAQDSPILALPRARVSFRVADLVNGRVRPLRISLMDLSARLTRSKDGRTRFRLGTGIGVALDDGAAREDDARFIAFVDALAGDARMHPAFESLQVVELLQSRLHVTDRATNVRWKARNATVRLTRDPGGFRAVLTLSEGTSGQGLALRVTADRRRGAGEMRVAGWFRGLDTRRLVPGEPGNVPVQAELDGNLSLTVDAAGVPSPILGTVTARRGKLAAAGKTVPFGHFSVGITADLATETLRLADLRFAGEGMQARIAAFARLRRDRQGAVAGIDAQIDVEHLKVDRPAWFSRTVEFDAGQFVLGWSLARHEIRLAEGWLSRGDVMFRAAGRLRMGKGGERADLRAEVRGIDIAGLIGHWPIGVAKGARRWIVGNVRAGKFDELILQVRADAQDARVTVDGTFSALESQYIAGMSPITRADGRLYLDAKEFHLELVRGTVDPLDGTPISLAGSTFALLDHGNKFEPAKVQLHVQGATAAVMALIDQKPLHLVRKLGLKFSKPRGETRVAAVLGFPLLDKLKVDDIEVSANAVMRRVATAMTLANGTALKILSDRLAIAADKRRMRVSGGVAINGAPVRVDWHEDYSARPGRRTFKLRGSIAAASLARLTGSTAPFGGSAAVDLTMTQTGRGSMKFALKADLRKSSMEIAQIGWTKPSGAKGTLEARGVLGRVTRIEQLSLTAPGLTAEGSVEFGPGGAIRRAHLSQVVVPGRMHASVAYTPGRNGVARIDVSGRLLDVSERISRRRGGQAKDARPFRARLDLERLKVTRKIEIRSASGQILRGRGGTISGKLTGRLGGAPVAIALDLPRRGPGGVAIRSSDAGAVLRAADIYRGARGGRLLVEAKISDKADGALTGRAKITNVVVRSTSTFREVLKNGGMSSARKTVESGGIGFREIWIPFTYRNGVVTVTDAVATSTMLGLKMTGTLDERTEALALTGVLSPAYGLTGALNDVPLLGVLLSGGQGEGIVAMTFTLSGKMRNPSLSVNPLSMLAPGFLRKLFSGGGGKPMKANELKKLYGEQDR